MILSKYKIIISFLALAMIMSWLVWFTIANKNKVAQAQTAPAQAETNQNDGLAVRVMPNDQHLSPLEWYKTNIKQQGSPARLLVDGYEALQEGRTIYVNAANVVAGLECIVNNSSYGLSHCSGKQVNDACYIDNTGTCQYRDQLYTNVYIISYTQEASNATREIFNQLLNNWTFNTNIIADSDSGACMDIQTNQVTAQRCYTDLDCGAQSGKYCASAKAKLTRDVRRMADIRDIERILGLRHNATQSFPALAAGSYLAGKTISVWPSWQATLGRELEATLPVDPLNSLWSCRNDAERNPAKDGTCWNENTKQFNQGETTIPDGLTPAIGFVYAYINDSAGNTRLCAVMETGYGAVANWQCSNPAGARVEISNITVTTQQ